MTNKELEEMTAGWDDESKLVARDFFGVQPLSIERAQRLGEVVGLSLRAAFLIGMGSGAVYAVWRFAAWIGS